MEQQLLTLPLSLGEQPSQGDLFARLRGARVQVTGVGTPFTGRLLSMEVRPAGSASDDHKSLPEQRVVTIVSDAGATRSVELGPNAVVRVLDAGLRTDLNTYLELLDRNRADGVRHLLLTDRGMGTRQLRVSFLSEVPVWKSTYRVLLTTDHADGSGGDGKATIQGFSVVDNITGEDWDGVQLSLIAGSPQSFLQPISQPIYDRRPTVPIAENAQATPQTHESGEGDRPPMGTAAADLSSNASGGPASLFGLTTGTGTGAMGGSIDRTFRAAGKIPRNMNAMKDTGPLPPPHGFRRGCGCPPTCAVRAGGGCLHRGEGNIGFFR